MVVFVVERVPSVCVCVWDTCLFVVLCWPCLSLVCVKREDMCECANVHVQLIA